ncbi:leucine-rich repeat-containing protein 34 [Chanos chanos]|uniref:Leucine-rich repeat-containing protein 34 n=1 Tax=Chanos chanos TaxID=29144 RepID=A0A6J2UVT5_CHACN|nr:leucine-rich repeat-containing protein 34 [Chanos chanos]
MDGIKNSYLSVCTEFQLPVNSYVLQVLQDTEGTTRDIVLKLTGNNRLREVQRLNDSDVFILSKTLRNNFTIKGLDLRYNSITDQGAAHLSDLIQENKALQSLDLMCNDIKADGAEVIAKSLQKNGTLKSLRMTGNKIGNKGGMHFASMLQVNTTLESLDLSDCDLDTQSLTAFSIVLTNNRSVRSINLSRPLLFSLQEETTVHTARMLVMNKSLRELHLGKHGMTDSGLERLCEALKLNATLSYLDLRCNRITRDGAKCLAEVLKQNSSLEILDLSSNRIEDDGAVYFSEALTRPECKLKALSIPFNNIGTVGLLSLSRAMKMNCCLTHIYIWGNKLEEPVCEAFSQLIQSGQLLEGHTDVSPYVVDGRMCLAEVFHGLRRHYYWTPSYGEDGDPACNAALALNTSLDDSESP